MPMDNHAQGRAGDGYHCGCCGGLEATRCVALRKDGEGRPGEFALWRCQTCGFIQLWPQPEEATLAAYYNSGTYYAYQELSTREATTRLTVHDWLRHSIQRLIMETSPCSMRPKTWRDRWRAVLAAPIRRRFGGVPAHQPTGPLLDLGCGDGMFLYELQRLGWTVAGMEMDERAVEAARRFGIEVRQGTTDAIPFPPESFSVVRMWHVLEHVRDPRTAVRNARRILRPGGELIIGVPNVACLYRWCFGPRWSGWDLPRHLSHFSPKTIRRLLEAEGFQIRALHCSSVSTGSGSVTALCPWLNHPVVRYPLVLLDIPWDLLGIGDALEVVAVATP